MSTLPGLETDFDLRDTCEAETVFYRALRCYHIAESFQLVKRWPECLAMFERSADYARKAGGLKTGLNAGQKTKLKDLLKKIEGGKVAAQASSMSFDGDAAGDEFKALSSKGKERRVTLDFFVAVSTDQYVNFF
jgi:hypothetical protein